MNKQIYILSLLVLFVTVSLSNRLNAQIKTDITILTPQEQQYLSTAKSSYNKYQKLYKKFRKDSSKLHRRLLKVSNEKGDAFVEAKVAHYSDSLKTAYNLSAYAEEAESYKQYLKDPDSVEWKEFYLKSKSQLNSKLSEVEEYKELKALESEMNSYTGKLTEYSKILDDPDSALMDLKDNAISKVEKKLEEELMKRDEIKELQKQDAVLQSMTNLPEETKKQMLAKLGKINPAKMDLSNVGKDLQAEAAGSAKDKAKSLVDQLFDTHGGKIDKAVAGFNDLKKKYQSVVQNGDEMEYVKKNKFQDASPIQRIIIGGNFKNQPQRICHD